jgi:cell division protein FtsB
MAEAGLNAAAEASAADRRDKGRRLTSIQVMLALALAFGLILTLNFSSRITLDRDLGRIHARFSAEIEALLAEQQKLIEELSYVKSDAYVEYWARDEGKMIREGEVLIMPKSGAEGASMRQLTIPLVEFETTAPEPENWELWWALFFDGPPPRFN